MGADDGGRLGIERCGAERLRLGILASHAGTTMQAVLDACASGDLDADVGVVISNNSRSGALARARSAGIPALHLSSATHPDEAALDRAVLAALTDHDASLIVLAGYMKRLGPLTLSHYRGRVLNTHPALLPKFGGRGMFGDRVHEAVLAAGEKVSGATVHVVDGDYDTGPILSQRQVEVPKLASHGVAALRDEVQKVERLQYVQVLGRVAKGETVPVLIAAWEREQSAAGEGGVVSGGLFARMRIRLQLSIGNAIAAARRATGRRRAASLPISE